MTMTHRILLCSALLCCLFEPLRANPLASVGGRVVDPSGAAIPGARVTAAAQARAIESAATTNTDGEFSLPLPPGDYVLTVAAEGFANAVRTIAAEANRSTPLVIELSIGPSVEVVTVTDAATYQGAETSSATRTPAAVRDIPQSISIVSADLMKDRMMTGVLDTVQYMPGVAATQGENNRDQIVIRGNSSSADFFLNGVRDDVQYFRDVYNIERVEALKGPNAMIFGRGGGGGVINRVMKEAGFTPLRELTLHGGAFGHKRATADLDQPLGDLAAVRLNAMYEDSGSFRDHAGLERHGISPALTIVPDRHTRIRAAFEHYRDRRTADRGIPSFGGRPVDVAPGRFFGDPSDSWVRAEVNAGMAAFERQFGGLNLRNATLVGDYDRGYQNYVPGAVNADRTLVAISAYNNATQRRNLFNQTDLSHTAETGRLRHTLLWGAELGRQSTRNLRNTGYFGDSATSISVPLANPIPDAPAAFRQSATDAGNRVRANIAAAYFQDQVELARWVRVVAGVRVDRFDLDFHNLRTGETLERADRLVSPRAGVVFKPRAAVSLYGNYSISWLPGSGDQFASLTSVTQQLKPEKFTNYEAGVKWDVRRSLSLAIAVYRLDRTNTRSIDPNDPARIIQTGSQRTNGIELEVNGNLTQKWRVAGGYAFQDAWITRASASAMAGAIVPQMPRHAFSWWNNYQALPRLSVGLGLLNRSDMWAGIDNTVPVPGYTRVDAAASYSLTERTRFQANVENVLGAKYYLNAHGNNNISPGSPRAIRMGLIARF